MRHFKIYTINWRKIIIILKIEKKKCGKFTYRIWGKITELLNNISALFALAGRLLFLRCPKGTDFASTGTLTKSNQTFIPIKRYVYIVSILSENSIRFSEFGSGSEISSLAKAKRALIIQ